MIKTQSHQFSVMTMCRLLSVSVSGYYHWLNREPSVREKANLTLASKIKVIFDDEKSRAGAHRITHRLNAEGDFSSRHRVARIMRLNGWRARASKKFKATTNSNHRLPVAPNLLEQNFLSQRPNEKWVSDITYIWTEEGWLYLAVVMDLYSRLVVGWALSERMTAKLVIDALQMALWHRKPPRNLIVHSDRGSQYCALEYQKLFVQHGLICSMSKRGDCFDNAAMESWNHSFKVEAIHGEKLITRAFAKNHVLAKNHVFEYIEIYYNRKRLHSTIGYKTPASFDIKMVA
jgi:transposase InsO family protein